MATLSLPPLPIETRVFTFYSFKGGVGRSMALVNTAAQLARGGRRVLVIDLDLEAPGVSYLARQKAKPSKRGGFVDLLYDFLKDGENSSLGDPSTNDPFSEYTMDVDLGDTAQAVGGGVIAVMPSGNLSDIPEYQRRVGFLEFGRLYREGIGGPLLGHVKKRLRELGAKQHFDYVLVDSRTGYAAESTIAVRDLADHLIVIMGLNHQNVEGTCGFLRALHTESNRPASVTIVISPIPLGEDELAAARIETARKEILKAWPNLGQKAQVGRYIIPYHPRLALDESPHRARLTNQPLTQAYRDIYEQIRNLANDSFRFYSQRASALVDSGAPAEALPYIARLVNEGYPGNYDLARRALLFVSDPKTQTAYVNVLRPLASSSLEVARSIAALLENKNAVTEADKILTEFVDHNPEDAMGWLAKASILERTARLEEATVYLQRATTVAPQNPWVWNRYASHLWELRHALAEADAAFQQWAKLTPKSVTEFSNYAEFCLAARRYDEAREAMDQAWAGRLPDQWPGHLLFCAAILSRLLKSQESERLQLRRIKWALNVGLRSPQTTFSGLLRAVSADLGSEESKFYTTLALVITAREQALELMQFGLWASLPRAARLSGNLFPRIKKTIRAGKKGSKSQGNGSRRRHVA